MSVRLGLLAILDQGPCYGYQLRQEFDLRTAGAWPVNVGQVYNTLDRLERDGLVTKSHTDREGHQYWEITTAGSQEVSAWLTSPLIRSDADRDELAIKLALASTLPGVDVARLIEDQRTATLDRASALTAAMESGRGDDQGLAAALLADWSIAQADAEIAWLDRARTLLNHASDAGLTPSIPVRTDPPRRGRPPAS